MNPFTKRMNEIKSRTAHLAFVQPRLDSGLWFHDDIRNNYYYASYLIAAAADLSLEVEFDREEATLIGSDVLHRVLSLQNRQSEDPLYGHWPLNLNPDPSLAKPNVLPVELMGCLMVLFLNRYGDHLPESVRIEYELSLEAIYRSSFFRVTLHNYNHHDAKYTASKLIFGYRFEDEELLTDGRRGLLMTLNRLHEKGMPEYGALPWFWHWVQAYTCAWECVPDEAIRSDLRSLLDFLWLERSSTYLGGAWVGARMRSLAHDLPRDRNVAFDYVQFGDFPLPSELPRVEYAGFLFHEAPEEARRMALHKDQPVELNKTIIPADAGAAPLHSYSYITGFYAAGGVLERVKEFDNEQHRWEIAFPLGESVSINRLYWFQPGEGFTGGDPRHQCGGEVLFHRDTIIALYSTSECGAERLIGVLPKGRWIEGDNALFGYYQEVYVAIYLRQKFMLMEEQDRFAAISEGLQNGVVVEAISAEELERYSVGDLEAFVRFMADRAPTWEAASDAETVSVSYTTIRGDHLRLSA